MELGSGSMHARCHDQLRIKSEGACSNSPRVISCLGYRTWHGMHILLPLPSGTSGRRVPAPAIIAVPVLRHRPHAWNYISLLCKALMVFLSGTVDCLHLPTLLHNQRQLDKRLHGSLSRSHTSASDSNMSQSADLLQCGLHTAFLLSA